jgi:hypothetical protein
MTRMFSRSQLVLMSLVGLAVGLALIALDAPIWLFLPVGIVVGLVYGVAIYKLRGPLSPNQQTTSPSAARR